MSKLSQSIVRGMSVEDQ